MSRLVLTVLFSGLLYSISSAVVYALTPEQVLGEYWKDPIFGQASASITSNVEILNQQVWPEKIQVPIGQNVRFLFINKTSESHLFAFTRDLEGLLTDEQFQKFSEDELYHSQQKSKEQGGHHNHAGTSTDEAQDIVKTMAQRPTVFIEPGDQKEILIRFEGSEPVTIACVLGDHYETGYRSEIVLVSPDKFKADAMQRPYQTDSF